MFCQPTKRIELYENDYQFLNIYNVTDPLDLPAYVPSTETAVPDGFIKTKDRTFEKEVNVISGFKLGKFFDSLSPNRRVCEIFEN